MPYIVTEPCINCKYTFDDPNAVHGGCLPNMRRSVFIIPQAGRRGDVRKIIGENCSKKTATLSIPFEKRSR